MKTKPTKGGDRGSKQNNKHKFNGKKPGGGGGVKQVNGKQKKGSLKGQWNLVPIGEEFYTDKEFESLVSFEELVDYNVVNRPDGTKEFLSCGPVEEDSSKGTKRKLEIDEDVVEKDEIECGDDNVPEELTKKNKKIKNKTKAKCESSDDVLAIINTSAGRVVVESDDDIIETVPKSDKVINEKPKNCKEKSKLGKKPKNGETKGQENVSNKEEQQEEEENDDFVQEEWIKLGVPEIVMRALKEKKFNRPTAIQTLTLPASILGKKDVVGAAETGSGKTLAFAIPIIDGILRKISQLDEDDHEASLGLKALILTPTRELAVQIKNHFDVVAKYTNIKTVVIVGGLAPQKQERLLKTRPDVVIATPGRFWELVQEGEPHLAGLNQIRFLAVDETDRMVERGHFQELEGILRTVNSEESFKNARQNFIFSATLAFTHEPPQRLKKIGNKKMKQKPKKVPSKEKLKQIMEMVGLRPNPKIVDITTTKGTCENLTEMQISCSLDYKDYYLYYFLVCHPGRTIVFCNSINCVRRLTNLFFLLECGEVLPLHAEMQQKMRLRNLEKFTSNEKGILIATDVAARGLDIQNIQHVIHYQVPKTAESYIHRSGRTARAFKGGIAVLMVEPKETFSVKNILHSLGREELLPSYIVDGKTFSDLKSRVQMAIKVENFEHSVRKKLADYSWMEKAKKDMDLASSEDEDDADDGKGSANEKKALMNAKKQLEAYKRQLSQMLSNEPALLKRVQQQDAK